MLPIFPTEQRKRHYCIIVKLPHFCCALHTDLFVWTFILRYDSKGEKRLKHHFRQDQCHRWYNIHKGWLEFNLVALKPIFIIPLSKLDTNIKGAAHPGWYHVNKHAKYTLIDPVRCHLGSMAAWSLRNLLATSTYADEKHLHRFGQFNEI